MRQYIKCLVWHIKYTHALPKLELRQADTYCSVVKIARIMPRTYDVDAHTDVGCEKFTRDLKTFHWALMKKQTFYVMLFLRSCMLQKGNNSC